MRDFFSTSILILLAVWMPCATCVRHGKSLPLFTMRDHTYISTRFRSPNKMVGNRALLRPAFGGGMAGALHAITGPDHLTGLLAPCANKGFLGGTMIGAVWGFGHAISTVLLGIVFFFFKNQMSAHAKQLFDRVNIFSSVFVGLNLVIIGLNGLYEAKQAVDRKIVDNHDDKSIAPRVPYGLIFGNGLLHGFSVDGGISLIPSLTLKAWPFAMTFLISYAISTALVISAAAGAISAGVSKLDNLLDSNVPKILAYYSSILSVILGIVWSLYSLLLLKQKGEFKFLLM